jgi:hypothetical protein
MRIVFAFFLVAACAQSYGQEDTRARAYADVNKLYRECASRLQNKRYQVELEQCREDPSRDQYRCEHDAAWAASTKRAGEPDPNAECDVLKPTRQEFMDRLLELRNDT